MDFDDIELAGLSAAEIEELTEYIDPDNELLPASERIPLQTKKKSTGPFNRDGLMAHLETQAKQSTVGDDYIPFVKKQQPPKENKTKSATSSVKPIKTEYDDMLAMLDEDDLAELAAELGLHSVIDQAQSRRDQKQVANPSIGLRQAPPSGYYKSLSKNEDNIPQDADVEDVIQRLKDNDPSLIEVNLNNHHGVDSDIIYELFDAMKENTCLEKLLLSNVKADEKHAAVLAEVLLRNCTLRVLNLESNRITRKGIKAIMKALADNQFTVLRELRMVNQYFAGGAGAEGEIARYLEKVKSLTKLGYNFTVPSFRTKVDGFIMRNLDFERKKRAAMNM